MKNFARNSIVIITAVLVLFVIFPVASVKAAGEPGVETVASTGVTESSATINGRVTTNGTSGDVWFEWGDNPSNLYRTTAVQQFSGDYDTANYFAILSGLDSNYTYYYRAVARNDSGIVYGIVSSFTTSEATPSASTYKPDATTYSAVNVDTDSAMLRGEVSPNGLDTDYWFAWGTSMSNLSHATPVRHVAGSSGTVNFDETIYGLHDSTLYYFRVVAENDKGLDYGTLLYFNTDNLGSSGSEDRPDVTTLSARNVDADSATLRGEVDPNGLDTDFWFEWGDDRYDLNEETSIRDVDGDVSTKSFSISIYDLDPDETYYYRAVAENSEGIDRGSTLSLRTDEDGSGSGDAPDATTLLASGIGSTSALLNGAVDPNGLDTEAWFEWGTSIYSLSRNTSVQSLGDGTSEKSTYAALTGLQPNTIYYFRVVAENSDGIDRGSTFSLRTIGTTAPVTTSSSAGTGSTAATKSTSSTTSTSGPLSPSDIIARIVAAFRGKPTTTDVLSISLDADTKKAGSGEIEYTITYGNGTEETLTDAQLIVDIPKELEFVEAKPKEDAEGINGIAFDLGTIKPGASDSFVISTKVASRVSEKEDIVFTAHVYYAEGDSVKSVAISNVMNTSNSSSSGGGFAALLAGSAAGLLTNPLLWLMLLVAVVFFVYRYFVSLAKPAEEPLALDEPLQEHLTEDKQN